MTKRFRLILLVTFVIFMNFAMFLQPSVQAEENSTVYIVPIEHGIERGLERFLVRSFDEAEAAEADVIILEINTLGGMVDAAYEIGNLIERSQIPVVAFIKGNAISAGAYISLHADEIYMEPGSSIGAAEMRTIAGEKADPKLQSVWISEMRGAAKLHGRDADIAEGMVNTDLIITGIKEKGELITLDSEKAVQIEFADGIANTREELLEILELSNAQIEEVGLSPAEQLARFVTSPIIIPILLIIGLAGIVIELLAPGFGVPGIVGISSFGLYFFGHFFAGFAGWEAIIFFIAGIILMAIELFVPGFGIFGILGIISFSLGISLAAYETTYGLMSLVAAFVINIILAVILVKYFGKKGVWHRFILSDQQKKDGGYVSHNKDRNLVGKQGKTITKLRPSGTAMIEEKRYDVISEGNIIEANKEIEVIMIEGTRIVVRELN